MNNTPTKEGIASDKSAFRGCISSQMELLKNPKAQRDFGLAAFKQITARLERNDYERHLLVKDSVCCSIKYYMTPKEFNYLREELSVELDPDYMHEKFRLSFSINSVFFEVERVDLATAKKMRNLKAS